MEEKRMNLKEQQTPEEQQRQIRKIHPVITYPYRHPRNTLDMKFLYSELVRKLDADKTNYCHPVTIVPMRTKLGNETERSFIEMMQLIEQSSDIVYGWSVDTCATWLAGLGDAFFCRGEKEGRIDDVYWLIPADFNYESTTAAGCPVLDNLMKIPEKVQRGACALCLGEIKVEPNSSKQLIDTYGTYGLLYNWFPAEAQGIRKITDKPRTEFFAVHRDFLRTVIRDRWYAYAQTIVILLQAMRGDTPVIEIGKVDLVDQPGLLSDEPTERRATERGSLAGAITQVERIERVLKLYWRERYQKEKPNWPDEFRQLDAQSEKIREAALVILRNILS